MAGQQSVQELIQSLTPSATNNGNPNTVYNRAMPQGGYVPPTFNAATNTWRINPAPPPSSVDWKQMALSQPQPTAPSWNFQRPTLPGPITTTPPTGTPPTTPPPAQPPSGGGGGGEAFIPTPVTPGSGWGDMGIGVPTSPLPPRGGGGGSSYTGTLGQGILDYFGPSAPPRGTNEPWNGAFLGQKEAAAIGGNATNAPIDPFNTSLPKYDISWYNPETSNVQNPEVRGFFSSLWEGVKEGVKKAANWADDKLGDWYDQDTKSMNVRNVLSSLVDMVTGLPVSGAWNSAQINDALRTGNVNGAMSSVVEGYLRMKPEEQAKVVAEWAKNTDQSEDAIKAKLAVFTDARVAEIARANAKKGQTSGGGGDAFIRDPMPDRGFSDWSFDWGSSRPGGVGTVTVGDVSTITGNSDPFNTSSFGGNFSSGRSSGGGGSGAWDGSLIGNSSSGGSWDMGSGCVVVDSVLEDYDRADDVNVGDTMEVIDPKSYHKSTGTVSYSTSKLMPCVRVTTETGVVLDCSTTAPIADERGEQVLAPALKGKLIPVYNDGNFYLDRVESVEDIGEHMVRHITVENNFFLAGKVKGRYMFHHNVKMAPNSSSTQKPPDPSSDGFLAWLKSLVGGEE